MVIGIATSLILIAVIAVVIVLIGFCAYINRRKLVSECKITEAENEYFL